MKENRLIICGSALFAMLILGLSTGAGRAGELRDALKHAGGNRSELETALRKIKGRDTEYLIAQASQY